MKAWIVALVLLPEVALAQTTDELLTSSQLFLASASTAEVVTRDFRVAALKNTDTVGGLSVAAMTIVVERLTHRRMGKKVKIAVIVLNTAAGVALSVAAHRNVDAIRQARQPGAP